MRGLSGAIVTDDENGVTVTKRGGIPERTREQGEWIQLHSNGHTFPKLIALLDDGYVMERLEFIDYWDVDPYEMVDMLRAHVWCQPAVVPPTTRTSELLVAKMSRTLDKWLEGKVSNVIKNAVLDDARVAGTGAYTLPSALAHGDPTAENVMLRAGYGTVLIDPIRSTEVVPDSPAVDIGKMLQSACGWENAKYGTGPSMFTRSSLRRAIANDELFSVGEAWATVHVIRAIPYVIRNIPKSTTAVLDVLERAIERG